MGRRRRRQRRRRLSRTKKTKKTIKKTMAGGGPSSRGKKRGASKNRGRKEAWMDDEIELANKTVRATSGTSRLRIADDDESESEENEEEEEPLMDVSEEETSEDSSE